MKRDPPKLALLLARRFRLLAEHVSASEGRFDRMVLGALVAAVVLHWIALGLLPLWDPSEGRYAAIAQSMARSGDWVTPRFPDGSPFLGKPPLHFWLTAASLRLFGPTEFAARLPSAAAGLVVLAVTYLAGRRAFGAPTGLLGALLAATTVLGLGYSALALTDMTFAACVALALAAFAAACVDPPGGRSSAAGLAFFCALGLAMLAKGPLGVALCGVAIGLWSALERDLRWLRRLPWLAGTLLFLAVCIPWYVAAEIRTPGFLRYFFVQENFLRFLTVEYGDLYGGPHARPYGFVWLLTGIGLLPWSILLVSSGLQLFRRRGRPILSSAMDHFVLAWALAAPLFFTLSRGVVLSYVLPSLPGLALLAARAFGRSLDAGAPAAPEGKPACLRRALFFAGAATCGVVASAALLGWARLGLGTREAVWIGLVLPSTGLVAVWWLRRSARALVTAVALLWAVYDLSIRVAIRDEVESKSSTAHLAHEIELRPELGPCEVVFFAKAPYSVWFYLAQPSYSLRKARPRLEEHLSEKRCHVLVFEEEDLDRFEVASSMEQLCEHGRYRMFVDAPS